MRLLLPGKAERAERKKERETKVLVNMTTLKF